ncbi:MAG: winged helix-turn-helix transcriptional regulator, partial [Promethearchaeota archaeon]
SYTIQFLNHFGEDASLKYDVKIENYEFGSDDENAMLVLGYQLTTTDNENDDETPIPQLNQENNGSHIAFGEKGYFRCKTIAEVNGTEIAVGVSESTDTGNLVVYTAFERFDGTLLHDPWIGISETSNTPFPPKFMLYPIIGLGIILLVFGALMSKQEYRNFLLNRKISIENSPHKLSMQDVLENQKRDELIGLIIDIPGIHFNEILRQIDITPGNLDWHLNILEAYKVIKKRKVGQYILYFSYYYKNPFSEVDLLLQKNDTTMKILYYIAKKPNIYQKILANELGLNRSTIKYHLDKLIKAGIVQKRKTGIHVGYYVDLTKINNDDA